MEKEKNNNRVDIRPLDHDWGLLPLFGHNGLVHLLATSSLITCPLPSPVQRLNNLLPLEAFSAWLRGPSKATHRLPCHIRPPREPPRPRSPSPRPFYTVQDPVKESSKIPQRCLQDSCLKMWAECHVLASSSSINRRVISPLRYAHFDT